MWTEDLLVVLDQPFAAFDLRQGGAFHAFPDLEALCSWALDRKGSRRFGVRDGHLVWGAADGESRATVALDLTEAVSGKVVETWRLLTMGQDAVSVLAAVKAVRAARRQAA